MTSLGIGEWSIIVNEGNWKPRSFDVVIIELLQYALQGKVSNLLISLPPRHGKSTLISRNFASYFLSHFPHDNIILSSYTQGLASEFGGEVKDIINQYGAYSPYNVSIKRDSHAKNKFHIDHYGGRMLSVGAKGGIVGFGAGLFIIDDPVKAEEIDSLNTQRKLERWFYRTARTRLEKRHNGLPPIMVIIAQRLHMNDLHGIITKSQPDNILPAGEALQLLRSGGSLPESTWVDLNIPSLCVKPEIDLLGREEGEALWPEQIDKTRLQNYKETMGTLQFNTIYQGHPTVDEGQMFKRRWFYDAHDQLSCIVPDDLIPRDMPHLRYYDTASGGPRGDETSGMLTTYNGRDMYVLHMHNNHYWPNELTTALTSQILEDDEEVSINRGAPYMTLIEQEGGSQTGAYISDLQHHEDIMDNEIIIRADKVRRLGPKRNRAAQLAVMAEFGHVYFSDNIPVDDVEQTVEQLIMFTGEDGVSDDRVDSLGGSARYWKREENRNRL